MGLNDVDFFDIFDDRTEGSVLVKVVPFLGVPILTDEIARLGDVDQFLDTATDYAYDGLMALDKGHCLLTGGNQVVEGYTSIIGGIPGCTIEFVEIRVVISLVLNDVFCHFNRLTI